MNQSTTNHNHNESGINSIAHQQQSNRNSSNAKAIGSSNDVFNNSNLKQSATIIPDANNSALAKFKKAATKGFDNDPDNAASIMDSSRGNSQKIDEQRIQFLTAKINILNASPANLTGAIEDFDDDLAGYHVNQYKLLGIF